MKNYLVIILSFALCLSLAACNAVDNGENIDGAQVIENTEGNTEKENSSMNTSIVYSPTHSTDRVLVSFDFLERRIALSMSEDRGYAMCLVTVVDIDLDDISDSVGVRIPLTLRIDKVISSNTSFDIAQGESILTADYSLWSQTGEDYSVCYADGVIPITERGAQYIVILTEEGSFDDISFDIAYRTECYTVPITSSSMSANELATQYVEMQLPEDVRKLATDLIKEEFGENSIPDFDEIEAVLGEMAK